MGSRIVKQPDGKLARFSDVVDNFTHYNMDRDQAISLCKEDGMDECAAIAKVQRGIDDVDPRDYSKVGAGLDRWNDAISTIEGVHGKSELKNVLATILGTGLNSED